MFFASRSPIHLHGQSVQAYIALPCHLGCISDYVPYAINLLAGLSMIAPTNFISLAVAP